MVRTAEKRVRADPYPRKGSSWTRHPRDPAKHTARNHRKGNELQSGRTATAGQRRTLRRVADTAVASWRPPRRRDGDGMPHRTPRRRQHSARIIDRVHYRRGSPGNKVYIIERWHMPVDRGVHALLKTLEERPSTSNSFCRRPKSARCRTFCRVCQMVSICGRN